CRSGIERGAWEPQYQGVASAGLSRLQSDATDPPRAVCYGGRGAAGGISPAGELSVSDRMAGHRAWRAGMVALGLLLSLHDLPTRLREAQAQHSGPGVVFLAPVEEETGSGRYAILAMTLNPRVRIVAGSLVLVRVGTKDQRPLTGTATHFHEPPDASAGWSAPM